MRRIIAGIAGRWSVIFAFTIALAGAGTGNGGAARAAGGTGLPTAYRFHVGRDAPVGGALGPIVSLALGRDDTLYAIDGAAGRVLRIGHTGELLGAWGTPGGGPGEFGDGWGAHPDGITRPWMTWAGPSDVAIGPDGDVYVADPFNGRVQRFTPWGAFVERFCVLGPPDEIAGWCATAGTDRAWSVAVGPDGSVFAAVPERKTIRRIGPGAVQAIDGIAAGDLAIDRSGRLYAAEPDASRFVVFDAKLRRIDAVERFQICGGDGGGAPMVPPNPEYHCNPFVLTLDPVDRLYVGLGGALAGGSIARRAEDGTWPRYAGAPTTSIGGIAAGGDGAVYVGCYYGPVRIRRIDAAGRADPAWSVRMPDAGDRPIATELGDAAFRAPSAVASDGNDVVVSDGGHRRRQWLDAAGMPTGSLVGGDGSGEIGPPSSALVGAPDGGVLAGDARHGLVWHLTRDGATGRRWGFPGADPPGFGADMSALVRLDDGGFVVAERSNRRLLHFGADGAYVDTWLGDEEAFVDLARAPDGTIVAAGRDGTELIRIAQNGRVVHRWPISEHVRRARGVAVATDGTVLVADEALGQVARFAPDGVWLGAVGDDARLTRFFSGIAALPDGRIAVVVRATDDRLREKGRVLVLDAAGNVQHEFVPAASPWFLADDVDVTVRGTLLVTGAPDRCDLGVDTGAPAALEIDLTGGTIRVWPDPDDASPRRRCARVGGAVELPDGGLLVAHSHRRMIYRLAADGAVTETWRTTRTGAGGLDMPGGVAWLRGPDDAWRVFVADTAGGKIARFAWDGAVERAWTAGPDGRALYEPRQLAAAPDGTLWVADTGNHRLAHFAFDGTPLNAIGHHGTEPDGFESPEGVAVLADGTIVVADTGHRRLAAFAPDGTFLAAWRGDGPPGTALRRPAGLSVADDGTLWVADREADRIIAFGTAPEIGWHVQYYRDGGLLDGPVAAQWIPGRHLDLDWQGQPPAPGLGATGYSLRAERRAGAPLAGASAGGGGGACGAGATSVLRRLSLAVRGGMTLVAPHGQRPIVLAGNAAVAAMAATTTVRRALDAEGDWLRVDFAATGARPMVRVVETRNGVVVLPFAGRDAP